MNPDQPLSSTPRTTLHRLRERGRVDPADLDAVLGAGLVCHLGVVIDGAPVVLPTGYGRIGDTLYLHGSSANRSLLAAEGQQVCVTVTLLDGLVLARSIFNHSMNYRSVVILGKATLVHDPAEKLAALRVLSEHIIPHRWDDVRQPNERELKATSVLRLPIEEFSAKVRQGPAIDDEEDYTFPTWAGVVPLEMVTGTPIDDARLIPGKTAPEYARGYTRKH
jgi:uncharacterized protein